MRQDAPLANPPDYTRAEIGFLLANEMVGRLTDVAFRRTDIALSGRLTAAVATELADIAHITLGWSLTRRAEELAGLARRPETRHDLSAAFKATRPDGTQAENGPAHHAAAE